MSDEGRRQPKKLLPERLWIFNFDGTLSQFVSDRSKAVLHPECRDLLLDLTASDKQHVAILSSRTLDDLTQRIDIDGLYLGGSCGVDWRLPNKARLSFAGLFKKDLLSAQNLMMRKFFLLVMCGLSGLEIEDKKWSITIHLRQASPKVKEKMRSILNLFGFQTFKGHEAIETTIIKDINKKCGVSILCDKIFKYDEQRCLLIYAGSDEMDGLAMTYVLSRGGIAISVADDPIAADAITVKSPDDLASTCRQLFVI